MMRLGLFIASFSLASCAHIDPVLQPVSQDVTLASGATLPAKDLDAALLQASERASVTGFSIAVINDAQIVYHRNFGEAQLDANAPVTDDTLFEFASMSKPVFGALVVQMASDGLIDLDEPLANYMPHPDLPDDPRAARITARQVLTHQTGLPNWRTDTPDGRLEFAFEPGTSWRYSGEGYEYLADVLIHILDTDDRGLDAIFQRRIAEPAGATDTFFVQDAARLERKATGYSAGETFSGDTDYAIDGFGAAYSVHSTADDYARLMIGLMRGGPSLNEAQRGLFFAAQGVALPEDSPERALGLVDYALGYAIFDLPLGRFYIHGGNNEGFSGMSAMQPDSGWAFVIVTNENQANEFQLGVTSLLIGLEGPSGE